MIVVTGPPRSGKNFILDVYKGCDVTTAVVDADHPLEGRPSVVKCAKFKKIIDSDRSIDLVFIMVRDIDEVLDECIEARISKDRRTMNRKIFSRVGRTVLYCELNQIEYEFIHYPAILHQYVYAFDKLQPESDGIHTEDFERSWERARRARIQ